MDIETKNFLNLNGLDYYNKALNESLNKKVDKVDGKVLSSNDYTTTEKLKLENIEENANNYELPIADANTLGGIKVGANLSIENGVLSADAGNIAIDSALSSTSEAPVQNKVITAALGEKVDKVAGKSLSSNDYTNAEKTKLSEIADNAQVNIIETIKVNDNAQSVISKTVNINIPTNNNQLTNGAGYQTAAEVETAINAKLGSAVKYKGSVQNWEDLPEAPSDGDMYNIVNASEYNKAGDNVVWVEDNKNWDLLSGIIDTSNFWNTTNLVAITNEQIDTILGL